MEGSPGITKDTAQLCDEDKGKKGLPYGPSYGTLQDKPGHEDLDDEPPRPPLTLWTLGFGLILTVIFGISAVLLTTCLVHIGHNIVPTLELIAISYAIQMICLIPFCACQWQVFRETTQVHIVWMLASGLCVSLGFLCIYQSALTLPGNVTASMGQAAFLLLTFLFSLSLDCIFDRVYSGICLASFLGLIMMTIAMSRSANETGWSTLVSARSIDEREGVESDQGASIDVETATIDPSQLDPVDEGDNGGDDYYDIGSVSDDPRGQLMYAYITVIMGAFLASVGCSIIHRRLHSISLSSMLFWLAVTGTVLATLEMALFTNPTWPPTEKALPVVGFLFLFNLSVIMAHTIWRYIWPTLFVMTANIAIIFYMILLAAAPNFMSISPSAAPKALEIVGAIVVVMATVAAIVWVVRGICKEDIKE